MRIYNSDGDKLKIGTTAAETGTSVTIDSNRDVVNTFEGTVLGGISSDLDITSGSCTTTCEKK